MRTRTFKLAAVALSTAFVFACDDGTAEDDAGVTGDGGPQLDGGNSDAGSNPCTTDADGGNAGTNPCGSNQVCDHTFGRCIARCDLLGTPTQCEPNNEVCDTNTATNSGRCIPVCTVGSCTPPLTCDPGGLCMTGCQDTGCAIMQMICNASSNDCGDPDTVTGGCTVATTVGAGIPPRDTGGPLVRVTAADGDAADDTAQCTGNLAGGNVVFFTLTYIDPDNDFPTTNGELFTNFKFWRDNVGGAPTPVDGYSNAAEVANGATRSAGAVTVPICFMTRATEIVISVKDSGGRNSNKVCSTVPGMM